MSAPWLLRVLETCSTCCLDSEADRKRVADAIVAALPTKTIASNLKETIRSIAERDLNAPIGMRVAEITRNAGHAVQMAMESAETSS